MNRLTVLVLTPLALSGCAGVAPFIELGLQVGVAMAQAAAASDHTPSPGVPVTDDVEDATVDPVEKQMERSRLRFSILYDDVTKGAPCPFTAERTGQRTWRLDSCSTHVGCHLVGDRDFTCSQVTESQPTQL